MQACAVIIQNGNQPEAYFISKYVVLVCVVALGLRENAFLALL